MDDTKPHSIPNAYAKNTHLNELQYHALYQHSIDEPNDFWNQQAQQFVSWMKPWDTTFCGDFQTMDVRWFVNGKLNACYNCVDRHLPTRGHQVAIIWEGNEPHEHRTITYAELFDEVCRLANALKQLGIQKGDRVGIYLPMIPEAVVAMLACARIGAIHSVVFGGFSAEALSNRIQDADCRLLITADVAMRGEKPIAFKQNADLALESCPNVRNVIVVKRTGLPITWQALRDCWYHDLLSSMDNHCPPAEMDSADPLFILYTSGSTGKPKGILHSTGGYLVYVAMTHYYVFDYHKNDIYWCGADIGWITGHSYIVYGPLANGATTLLFEGVPHYPNYARYWEIIDRHQVNIFYTSPTAIRALRREGDEWVTSSSRQSLKLLGTVGEPINPDVWEWYYHVVGQARCPIVNTWWQTETGGILLTQLPGATKAIAGSVGWPFFGISPQIVNEAGQQLATGQQGTLVITKPWPGLLQTIYGDAQRFFNTYLKHFPGYFFTGDGAHCDAHNNFWITGRIDDVLNISGHRIGTEEVESALVSHPAVAEAAVVGIPDEIKGEAIYAFVTPKIGIKTTDELKQQLIQQVRNKIGPLATPETIQWTEALPKTRSGKIMRRILRQIAIGEYEQLGDLSTLADPSVVEKIIEIMR